MQSLLTKIGLGVALLLAVFIGGYQYGVSKAKTPETVTKFEYVDRIVEKEVKVYVKQNVKEDSKTTTTKPDGTVIVEEKKSDANTETSVEQKEKTKEKLISVDKVNNAKQWLVGLHAGVPLPTLKDMHTDQSVWGGSIEHRLIGPVFGGAWYLNTDKSYIGLSATVEL